MIKKEREAVEAQYQLCKKYNIAPSTFYKRLKNGMSIREAVEVPLKMGRLRIYTYKGFTGNIKDFANKYNMNYDSLRSRLDNGMNINEAIEKPLKKIKLKTIL